MSNSKFACPASPGDVLKFTRFGMLYDHYAVVVENGCIVHVTSLSEDLQSSDPCRSLCSSADTVEIKKVKFCDFAKETDKIQVESGNYKGKAPLPVPEIIERAHSKIGSKGYNVFTKNCEHFARWCRYGLEESSQIQNFVSTVVEGAYVLSGLKELRYTSCCGWHTVPKNFVVSFSSSSGASVGFDSAMGPSDYGMPFCAHCGR